MMARRFIAILLCCVGAVFIPVVSAVSAQQILPPLRQSIDSVAPRLATPIERALELLAAEQRLAAAVPGGMLVPMDSIRHVVMARAQAWLPEVQKMPATDLQIDAMSRVALLAGQDDLAKRYIDHRLIDTTISLRDKSFTLLLAVQAFSDTLQPSRLSVAEHYVGVLDTMPIADAGLCAYWAHAALAQAYDVTSDVHAMLRHGMHALKLVPQLSLLDRMHWAPRAGNRGIFSAARPFMTVANELSRTPEGRLQLDSLTQTLLAAGAAAKGRDRSFSPFAAGAKLLGHPAPAVQGMVWLNVKDSLRKELPLDDGIVRVVFFGDASCGSCLYALQQAERLQSQFPEKTEVLFVTHTRGAWGIRGSQIVSPEEEIQLITQYYLDTLQFSFPIALWAGIKQKTDEGGMLPKPSPNMKAFQIPLNPYNPFMHPPILIVDGLGIVRHVFFEFGRAEQARTLALVQQLHHKPS